MEDSSQTSDSQSSDTTSTSTQSRYWVINRLPPERLEWLRQQSLHVAEVYRRAAEAEANRQSPTIASGADDPKTDEPVVDPNGADNGKA